MICIVTLRNFLSLAYIPGIYQVRPHLIQCIVEADVAYGLANFQSVKKPIDVGHVLLRHFLNAMVVAQSMSCCWREFHRSMTRSEKKRRLTSKRHLLLQSWLSCPCVCVECEHTVETIHWTPVIHSNNFQQISAITSLFKCPQVQ